MIGQPFKVSGPWVIKNTFLVILQTFHFRTKTNTRTQEIQVAQRSRNMINFLKYNGQEGIHFVYSATD